MKIVRGFLSIDGNRGTVTVELDAFSHLPCAHPRHEQHMAQMKKDAEMKQHGNVAMGFDQDKTTHHFTLTADGGSIAVEANDPAGGTSHDQIRAHLREIAVAFRQGDFQKPFMTTVKSRPGFWRCND